MDAPSSLDSLFKEKLFRVPDYQRGYAWQHEQLKAFWEDLVNLTGDRSHYTGVLTLKEMPNSEIKATEKEYWLVQDHSYRLYHIVDGQQRLTTFVVFIQAIVDFVTALPENVGKPPHLIYLTDSLSIANVREKYLYMVKPTGVPFWTYKFGYTADNPSDRFLRHRILGESGGGTVEETFYTLNLGRAKDYFRQQLDGLYMLDDVVGLGEIYRKLTKRFLFNQYIIRDEFDVFVAFETMNNRGKKLSDLELLKNRLIYLTTLYPSEELDDASRHSLRVGINDAWKEVYHQLGRNKAHPLNDDDFLRAHWTMFFKYSRRTGRDYIRFLLDDQFTPQRVHQKVERKVELASAEELRDEVTGEDADPDDAVDQGEPTPVQEAALSPREIREFITSLKESAVHWFMTFNPHFADDLSEEEKSWIDRLNRVGMNYFRPLIMATLKSEPSATNRLRLYQKIERFIFLAFRLSNARGNYKSSEFYIAARSMDRRGATVDRLCQQLDLALAYLFDDTGVFRHAEFSATLQRKFSEGSGYYGWAGLRYFLYEYELSLLSESRQNKVGWDDLLKSERDRVSIEHIFPQTPTAQWVAAFADIGVEHWHLYQGSLGNLLLLSQSINSALQNDDFVEKRKPKFDPEGRKIRNGYADGSHSEIEVASKFSSWGPDEVRQRGIWLLKFMETRWDLKFKDDTEREKLLFLQVEPAPV